MNVHLYAPQPKRIERKKSVIFATVFLVILFVLGALAIVDWWQHRLSSDFRKSASEATAELDSFKETGVCSGALVYGFSVQRINLAVNKAERNISTKADEALARDLRAYYEALTDRKKNCDIDQKDELARYLELGLDQAFVHSRLKH